MNKYIKLVIAALMAALGVWMITEDYTFWGIITIILSALPIFLFFRNEYILMAFWQMRKQNLEGAKKWLSKITNMDSQLIKKQFGYYHYMQGLTDAQNNISATESAMKKALDYGLTFDHDKAMAHLSLAGSALAKGRKKDADRHLQLAKKLDKNNMLKEHIGMIKEQSKKVNVGRNMQNPNMRRRGKYF